MKRISRKKVADAGANIPPVLRGLFRSFAKLAERAAEDRPLLRGLRVAYDSIAERFVVAHAGSYVEFVLAIPKDCLPPLGEIECRRMASAGTRDESTIARFRFDEGGILTESTVPEFAGQNIDLAATVWSVVAAVLWINLHAQL
jgi:hypothetical protein